MGDKPVKPSREVRGGETVVIRQSAVWRTVRILGLPPNRVGAALVTGFMEDLTPAEELEKLKKVRPVHFEFREHGSGRPTKRDRRRIEHLKKMIDG